MVGADDMIGKVLLISKCLNMQGFAPAKNILFQDNQSAMLLESKGMDSAGKRMRHLDVRYFFIKDCVDLGEVAIEYCNTKNMIADFLTKPPQGGPFLAFREAILGGR